MIIKSNMWVFKKILTQCKNGWISLLSFSLINQADLVSYFLNTVKTASCKSDICSPRNTKQVTWGHNIIVDRWTQALNPHSRPIQKHLKDTYRYTTEQLWHKNKTTLRQLEDNSRTILEQSWTALGHIKANSRSTPEQLKDNSGDCRTTSWTLQGHLLDIPRTTLENLRIQL